MTVSYQYKVASSTSGGFTRLLFMWKGSLYKLIYKELLIFLICFAFISSIYRNILSDTQKKVFEKMVIYCDAFINLIPLSFVLGFYVAYVTGRWWQQYLAIPWPDKIMHNLALYLPRNNEEDRIIRRTLMRYLNLTLVLILRSISPAVKKRFPTMEHLIELGFMTTEEYEVFQSIPNADFNTYWFPCTWFIHLLKDVKEAKNSQLDPYGLKLIVQEFNEYRSKCGLLWSYDWISIPLVYTQVVTLATYSYFIAALIGRQFVESSSKPLQMEVDIYVPIFTIFQFFFFMGLLKVAEQVINPYGHDELDFELNWLIDRHSKVSYLGVDTLMSYRPPLVKDKYFDDYDLVLPYTGASCVYKKKTHRGSAHHILIPEEQQNMFLPEIIEECEGSLNNMRRSSNKSELGSTRRDSMSTISRRSSGYRKDGCMKINFPPQSTETKAPQINCTASTKPNDISESLFPHSYQNNQSQSTFLSRHSSLIYPKKRRAVRGSSEGNILPTLSLSSNIQNTKNLNQSYPKLNTFREKEIECEWKGIRWKPIVREKSSFTSFESSLSKDVQEGNTKNFDNVNSNLNDDMRNSGLPGNHAYINHAFISPTEEKSELILSVELGEESNTSGSKNKTVYGKYRPFLNDSLV